MSAPNSDFEARICAQLNRLQTSVDELRNRVEHLAKQSKGRDVLTSTATPDAAAPDPLALLTAAEVAALLQVDVRTLRRMRHERSFPRPTRLGRSLRWKRSLVERFLEGGKQ
jgi:excisionase family DNA binding protein